MERSFFSSRHATVNAKEISLFCRCLYILSGNNISARYIYDKAFKLEDCQTFRTSFQDTADAYGFDDCFHLQACFISDDSVGGKTHSTSVLSGHFGNLNGRQNPRAKIGTER